MHLPAPLRAAVGLVVTAAGEVKTLPDRAVELPMLAVGRALQVSLRAQQRYAQLAERGEQVLNGRRPGDEPPAWATFDDPLSDDDLHRTALAQLDALVDGFEEAARAEAPEVDDRGPRLADVFGTSEPGPSGPEADSAEPDAATVVPITEARNGARKTARKTSRKTAAKKTAAKPAAAKKTPAAKKAVPAKKTAPVKPISKPRHTAPSKFDDADD